MDDKKIICVEALHHGIPQVIKLIRVFTEELHASLPIACTTSDKRTVSLVKTYQEKTVRLVSSLNFIFSGFRPFCAYLYIICFEYSVFSYADYIDILFGPTWIVYSHIPNVTVWQHKCSISALPSPTCIYQSIE